MKLGQNNFEKKVLERKLTLEKQRGILVLGRPVYESESLFSSQKFISIILGHPQHETGEVAPISWNPPATEVSLAPSCNGL